MNRVILLHIDCCKKAESIPTTSAGEAVYDTTPRKPKYVIEGDDGEEDDEDNNFVEEEVIDLGRKISAI